MSNCDAGIMVNQFLKELISDGSMDRFDSNEKYKIQQILAGVVERFDGSVGEMLVGIEDYFEICS